MCRKHFWQYKNQVEAQDSFYRRTCFMIFSYLKRWWFSASRLFRRLSVIRSDGRLGKFFLYIQIMGGHQLIFFWFGQSLNEVFIEQTFFITKHSVWRCRGDGAGRSRAHECSSRVDGELRFDFGHLRHMDFATGQCRAFFFGLWSNSQHGIEFSTESNRFSSLGNFINMWGREWEKNHIFSENNLTNNK